MSADKAEIPELDRPGLRRFGLTTGAIVAALFGVLLPYLFDHAWPRWPWVIAAILITWATVAPGTLRLVYRGIDERHRFAEKFGVSEEDFLKGVFRSLEGS